MPDAARTGERIFRGIPVSPGICRGKILVLGKPNGDTLPRTEILEERIPAELKCFEQALVDTRHQVLTTLEHFLSVGWGERRLVAVARAMVGGTQGVMQVAITAPQNQAKKPNDPNHHNHQQ